MRKKRVKEKRMRRKKRKWRRGDEERVGGGWENELGFRLAFRVLYLVIIIIIIKKKRRRRRW